MKDQSNRTHLIKAYLNDSEYERFCRMAEATKRTNSDLVRRLLQTSVFVEFPPVEYREIIDQLEHIGIIHRPPYILDSRKGVAIEYLSNAI